MTANPQPHMETINTDPALIRVVIIEDMREVREGLTMLINGTPGFHCAGSYRTMREALDRIGEHTAEIILTDIGLPGMSGIEGARILRERLPNVPILALTVYDNDEKIFAALCAGAPWIARGAGEQLLVRTSGGSFQAAQEKAIFQRRVVRLFRDFHPPEHAEYQLTPQEMQLLKLLVDGHHYKTAAHELGISPSTVSFHLKNIYAKLQVHSKTEAVAKALREHLV